MINVQDNQKILFIGDSISDVGFNKRKRWSIRGKNVYVLQVAKALQMGHSGLKFFYKGIASNRSYHVCDRLTRDCINLEPDIIVLFIGVNDAYDEYTPENHPIKRCFEPNMQEIFHRIRCELPNARLVVLTPFLTTAVKKKQPFRETVTQ